RPRNLSPLGEVDTAFFKIPVRGWVGVPTSRVGGAMATTAQYLRVVLGPDLAAPSDAELLRRFAADRDAGAFELVVWRHAGLVLRVCKGVLRAHHAAEDAAQATFLALARQAARVGRRGSAAGWLFRVARRVAGRAARQQGRPVTEAGIDLDTLPAPDPHP